MPDALINFPEFNKAKQDENHTIALCCINIL